MNEHAMLRPEGASADPATVSRPRTYWARVISVGSGVGVLTGFFGGGGGFIIVPSLVLLLGMPMPFAVGTSLSVIALTSVFALVIHLASSTIDWPLATIFGGTAVVGALAAARLSSRLSSTTLTRIFAGLVAATALFLIALNIARLR